MSRDVTSLLTGRGPRIAIQAGAAAAVATSVLAAAAAGPWPGALAALCLGLVALVALKVGLVVLVRQRLVTRDAQRLRGSLTALKRQPDPMRQVVAELQTEVKALRHQVSFDEALRADLERALAQLSVINQELAHRRD